MSRKNTQVLEPATAVVDAGNANHDDADFSELESLADESPTPEEALIAEQESAGKDDDAPTVREPEVEVLPPGVSGIDLKREAAERVIAGVIFTPVMAELMERTNENVAKSTGAGLPDGAARAKIAARGQLFDAFGGLEEVIEAEMEGWNSELGWTVYASIQGHIYAAQKAMVYVTNLAYRKSLNENRGVPAERTGHLVRAPYGRFEADQRSEFEETEFHSALGAARGEDPATGSVPADLDDGEQTLKEAQPSTILHAFEKLHTYLVALHSFYGGAEMDRSTMPYMYVRNDESGEMYEVHSGIEALEATEVQAAERRIRRDREAAKHMQTVMAKAKAARAARRAA